MAGRQLLFLSVQTATLGSGGRCPQAAGPCCSAVAGAATVSLGGWKKATTTSFLVGSEGDVRHGRPRPQTPQTLSQAFPRQQLSQHMPQPCVSKIF